MDEYTRQGIDARYDAYFNAYDIKDEGIKKKIDDLFVKINELGESAKDYGDFEKQFAASPLNTEYITLFTEVAMNCPAKDQVAAPVFDENKAIQDRTEHETKRMLEEATRPIRRKIRWKMQDHMIDPPAGGLQQLKGLFKKDKK